MKNEIKDYLNYFEFSNNLDQVYLEDSFLENIIEESNKVEFIIDFAIRENSPRYQTPSENDFAFYLKGKIVFETIKSCIWYRKDFQVHTDALGMTDIGNIDLFIYCKNETYLDNIRADIQGNNKLSSKFTYLTGERQYIPEDYYFLSGEWGAIAIKSSGKPLLKFND